MDRTTFDRWVADAHEDALRKKNSALPLNRRVQTRSALSGAVPPLWRFTRGTLIQIGSLEVRL